MKAGSKNLTEIINHRWIWCLILMEVPWFFYIYYLFGGIFLSFSLITEHIIIFYTVFSEWCKCCKYATKKNSTNVFST